MPATAVEREMRDRFNSFVERHEIAWELTMAALAVAFVITGFAGEGATGTTGQLLGAADILLTAVFAVELGGRLFASRDRGAYLRGHWIDAVALIPSVRQFRLLRLLRLLRVVRMFAGIYRALAQVERLLGHRQIAALVTIWLAVMVLSSLGMYVAEEGVNALVTSPLDALWWGVSTLTTVGYGDVYPITAEGRIAAAVLMLLGISLFSIITATITGLVLQPGPEDSKGGAGDRLRTLASLHADGLITTDEFASKRAVAVAEL